MERDEFKKLAEMDIDQRDGKLDDMIQDMTDNGMFPDHTMKSRAEIRQKIDDLNERTGFMDDEDDRILALKWVIGEIDEL